MKAIWKESLTLSVLILSQAALGQDAEQRPPPPPHFTEAQVACAARYGVTLPTAGQRPSGPPPSADVIAACGLPTPPHFHHGPPPDVDSSGTSASGGTQ